MKIGDEVYVHGYVDEIRKDTIIIRNDGGYFGTVQSEVIAAEQAKPTTEDCSMVDQTCRNCKWSQTVCRLGDNLPCHSYEPKDEPQTDCPWK